MNRAERKQVAVRSSIIAFFTLALFAVAGASILALFGITLPAFRVAGGLLLFYIAFEMIFERRQERHEKSAERAITTDMIRNVAAFPLAIPLIAGPGAISAAVLLSGTMPWADRQCHAGGVSSRCASARTFLVFLAVPSASTGFWAKTGRSILTRLLGVILAALAVQFVADGIKALMAA